MHDTLGFNNAFGNTMRFRRYGLGNNHPTHCEVYEYKRQHLVAAAISTSMTRTMAPPALPMAMAVRFP